MNDLPKVIKSIFEARYLKSVQRSGTSLFLGPEVKESVIEHSFFACLAPHAHHRVMETPANLPKSLIATRTGALVSLHHKPDGSLRGGIGTFLLN